MVIKNRKTKNKQKSNKTPEEIYLQQQEKEWEERNWYLHMKYQ